MGKAIVSEEETAEAEVQTSDPAILQKIIIEFVINTFCIPLLWFQIWIVEYKYLRTWLWLIDLERKTLILSTECF